MAGNRNRNNSGSNATATAPRPRTVRRSVAPSKPVQVEAPGKKPEPKASVTHDMIAARAYELWKMRGGDADQNWHEAEELLRLGL